MESGDWVYVVQSINPVGGLLVSIPWGILKMGYPPWVVLITAPPLGYVQVIVVDVLWDQLRQLGYVRRFLEEKRSPRIERLLQRSGAFLPTVLATPLVGGWGVMLAMRYAQVPQRRVALPILLSLLLIAAATAVVCLAVPRFFAV